MGLNASLAVDASVKQRVQLLTGRTLVVVPEEVRLDPAGWGGFQARHRLDAVDVTPSQLGAAEGGALGPGGPALLVGGEAPDASTWAALVERGLVAYNLYGPTEATVDAAVAAVEEGAGGPNVGRPLANVEAFVLDRRGQPCPIGVAGAAGAGRGGAGAGLCGRPGPHR